jgi:hypothetical protein
MLGLSGGVRIFSHFAVVCSLKRPMAGSVGLFVATVGTLSPTSRLAVGVVGAFARR